MDLGLSGRRGEPAKHSRVSFEIKPFMSLERAAIESILDSLLTFFTTAMKQERNPNGGGLFDDLPRPHIVQPLAEGAAVLQGFAAGETIDLIAAVEAISSVAPFRHMVTPGGFRMSVAMTNCGSAGWISDESGYRYDPIDPNTGKPWPAIPPLFLAIARRAAAAAGFENFVPDACLINRYEPGARLTLHQDRDERDFAAPIVSVSLGLPAVFLFGGRTRKDRPRRIRLESGDIAVWGGPSRLAFHGIAPLADGEHPVTGRSRINLTFRKAL